MFIFYQNKYAMWEFFSDELIEAEYVFWLDFYQKYFKHESSNIQINYTVNGISNPFTFWMIFRILPFFIIFLVFKVWILISEHKEQYNIKHFVFISLPWAWAESMDSFDACTYRPTWSTCWQSLLSLRPMRLYHLNVSNTFG